MIRTIEQTQARKLNEIVNFVSSMTRKGFEIAFSQSGAPFGVKRSSLIRGVKANYSNAYFKAVGEFIVRLDNGLVVDMVAR